MKQTLLCLAGAAALATLFFTDLGSTVLSQIRRNNSCVVRVYNVDDVASVYINDMHIGRVTYTNTAEFDITQYLTSGPNKLRLTLENRSDGYTYGFEVIQNGEVTSSFECGVLNNQGCRKSLQTGIVFDRTLTLHAVQPLASNSYYSANANYYPVNAVANAVNVRTRSAIANAVAVPGRGRTPVLVTRSIAERDPRQKISIAVKYPRISDPLLARTFNVLSEQAVRSRIASFKKDVGRPDPGARMRELGISYSASLVDSRIVSIGFGAGTDTGGAHPNSYSFVLNYDLAEQRELGLPDLFNSNSDYLRTISDYCIRQLRNQVSDYESLRDGAAPTLSNYDSWLITRNGIEITFDAYQVASYAEGPKTVVVPYNVLRPFVRSGGPIAHLAR